MNALQQQLQSFGLNPQQWVLRRENQKIKVIHRADPSLVLVGTFAWSKKSREPKWQSLALAD